jgi:hypothetical protein
MIKKSFTELATDYLLSQTNTTLTDESGEKIHQDLSVFMVSSYYDVSVEEARNFRLANGTLVKDIAKKATTLVMKYLGDSNEATIEPKHFKCLVKDFHDRSEEAFKKNIWSPDKLIASRE